MLATRVTAFEDRVPCVEGGQDSSSPGILGLANTLSSVWEKLRRFLPKTLKLVFAERVPSRTELGEPRKTRVCQEARDAGRGAENPDAAPGTQLPGHSRVCPGTV